MLVLCHLFGFLSETLLFTVRISLITKISLWIALACAVHVSSGSLRLLAVLFLHPLGKAFYWLNNPSQFSEIQVID